jgi:superfamily I DNA/RNA helicase
MALEGLFGLPQPQVRKSSPSMCFEHKSVMSNMLSNFLSTVISTVGTGKTTTLIHLARRAAQVGHQNITYVTFNRAAARDGQVRFFRDLHQPVCQLDARTLHSCAMNLLSKQRRETMDEEEEPWDHNPKFLKEEVLRHHIETVLGDDIEAFLQPCYRTIELRRMSINGSAEQKDKKIREQKQNAKEQVVFYLFKTLQQLCRKSYGVEELLNPTSWERVYYPAKKYHNERNGSGEHAGFSCTAYRRKEGCYAEMIHKFWQYLEQEQLRTFDVEMKRAQLSRIQIPGTMLLVDECQDMDGCQIDWVAKQVEYGTHVYMVGDAAQTIYGFRGAKSSYMVNLGGDVINCTLTTSWRFGQSIARIANVVLFAKEKSPQTTGNKTKSWIPYRVTGGSSIQGRVTSESILDQCASEGQQVTIIAFANATLLEEAVKLLGMDVGRGHDDDGPFGHVVSQVASSPGSQASTESEENHSQDQSPLVVPKIHVNGAGSASGRTKWRKDIKKIDALYRLYNSPAGQTMILPTNLFPEFRDRAVSFNTFVQEMKDREMNHYAAALSVVSKFGDRTMEAVDLFEKEVIIKSHKAEDADFILSTCHAAKGLEWDNVQLCSDFTEAFRSFDDEGPPKSELVPSEGSPGVKRHVRSTWQFKIPNFGDNLNLLYVACTRAKKLLGVPESFKELFRDLDALQDFVRTQHRRAHRDFFAPRAAGSQQQQEEQALVYIPGRNRPLTEEQAGRLYEDICKPLRAEQGIGREDHLSKTLLPAFIPAAALDEEDDE